MILTPEEYEEELEKLTECNYNLYQKAAGGGDMDKKHRVEIYILKFSLREILCYHLKPYMKSVKTTREHKRRIES